MSVDRLLEERGNKYGDYTTLSKISQHLKDVLRDCPGWRDLRSIHKESLDLIMIKVARILNGDPNYSDNWNDIEGYAKLVSDRLKND